VCNVGGPSYDYTLQNQMAAEAAAARATEEARQARIRQGLTKIDETFAPFDDTFYDTRKSAFLDYYKPQIDDQLTDAKDRLTFALARNGNLKSTAAGDAAAKLQKQYTDNWASIVSRADADVNNLKSNVSNEKTSLVAQLNATADADRVSNDALSRTQIMYQNRPEYSPLGDIFSGVGDSISNFAAANQNRAIYDTYFGNRGTAGSSRVVR
jgi:hypothetical protein